MSTVRVGCSGFSYDDWVGAFYPTGLPAGRFLEYYASKFDTVEINMTYYRIPSSNVTSGWVRRTQDGFLFAIKAHNSLTHGGEVAQAAESVEPFLNAVKPLADTGRLGCILLQFPNSFRPNEAAKEHLEWLFDALSPHPLVCEFRHVSWARETVHSWLAKRSVGYCCVDEPELPGLMPREAVVTSSIGYVRFHGRNKAKWYDHDEAWERYHYLYEDHELREWIEPVQAVASRAETTFVYFNNHRDGHSAVNAATFRDLLEMSL